MRKSTEPLAEAESEPHFYTMRELNQNTAQVIDEINKSGRPAVVTKHGRYVAWIEPVDVKIKRASGPGSSSVSVLVSPANQNS